jgi:hypothetical protein
MSAENRFSMPFLVEPDAAAKAILKGIQRGRRTIRFPRRMALLTALYNRLPAPLYESLTQAILPPKR